MSTPKRILIRPPVDRQVDQNETDAVTRMLYSYFQPGTQAALILPPGWWWEELEADVPVLVGGPRT